MVCTSTHSIWLGIKALGIALQQNSDLVQQFATLASASSVRLQEQLSEASAKVQQLEAERAAAQAAHAAALQAADARAAAAEAAASQATSADEKLMVQLDEAQDAVKVRIPCICCTLCELTPYLSIKGK